MAGQKLPGTPISLRDIQAHGHPDGRNLLVLVLEDGQAINLLLDEKTILLFQQRLAALAAHARPTAGNA